jgi:hypothetical protein
MVLRVMNGMGIPKTKMLKRCMCGDDEDALFTEWSILRTYAALHSRIGWHLKPSKQLCGPKHHEYLQRTILGEELPTRPIATLLETLATGNWYTRPAIWYDSAISSVSDNIWELHLRGMPLYTARKYASITINAMMRIPDRTQPGRWIQLEWWDMRHAASKTPLWKDTGPGGHEKTPDIKTKLDPGKEVASLATQDLLEKYWPVLKHVPVAAVRAYKSQKRMGSYAKLFTTYRLRFLEEQTAAFWPRRYSEIQLPADSVLCQDSDAACRYGAFLRACLKYDRTRRPNTEAEVLSRMRLDPELVTLVGGLNVILRYQPPKTLTNYTRPTQAMQPTVLGYTLDPALRSWLYQDGYVPEPLRRIGY